MSTSIHRNIWKTMCKLWILRPCRPISIMSQPLPHLHNINGIASVVTKCSTTHPFGHLGDSVTRWLLPGRNIWDNTVHSPTVLGLLPQAKCPVKATLVLSISMSLQRLTFAMAVKIWPVSSGPTVFAKSTQWLVEYETFAWRKQRLKTMVSTRW